MKDINTKLTIDQCWKMVNRIQCGKSPKEIRERCEIAKQWLTANETITNDQYDELMDTVAYLHRESYHIG